MKICIVANNAYGALTGEESGHIGGVERQTSLLSEWLSEKGHQVTVITWDEGGSPIEFVNNIKIIKLCKVSEGLPILRFFTPRWTSLISALAKADAEIYYHNCAEYVTGQVSLWCKINNKPFIYSIASDADCEKALPNLKSKREEYLFRYGLTHANLVISQTRKQSKLLKQNYDIDAQVINMPATPPNYLTDYVQQHLFTKQKVIWVGRLHKVKRIEWLIDIAEQLPSINFEVIGPADDKTAYIKENIARLTQTQNINYLGKISRLDMPKIYQNASILCCTSIYEGFPNTYLEAWSYGVPVITTIDPDDLIKGNQLGYHAQTISDFTEKIRQLITDEDNWQVFSQNCLEYYLKNHEQQHVMKQFEVSFFKTISKKVQQHFDYYSDTWADFYHQKNLTISHIDLQQRLACCCKILKNIPPSSNVKNLLDMGCGSGSSFDEIKNTGNWNIHGIDISPEMVKKAQNVLPDIKVLEANATNIPFQNNTFDTVITLGVLEYIKNYTVALSETARILKNDGVLIISIPNKFSVFRILRRIENFIVKPLKIILQLNTTNIKTVPIYHQQWSIKAITKSLKENSYKIKTVEYSSFGLLSPKLDSKNFNLKLSFWLTKKLKNNFVYKQYLANTIIIEAQVDKNED
jgi:glycosyltransferase involved in cell wall biosynthesis/ubiquinone/menaquinone biosynthesis C-methylase UbiE